MYQYEVCHAQSSPPNPPSFHATFPSLDFPIFPRTSPLIRCPPPPPLKKIVSFVSDVFYRVFRKNCVFCTIHCNPSLAYIAERDFQSSQRNASEQSLLLAGKSCTTNSSRVLARERWQTFENSWKKYII